MKPYLRLLFYLPAIAAIISCHSAKIDNKVEVFFARQDSLFIQSYEKRDTATYQKRLTEFLSKYRQLTDQEQRQYKGSLVNAYYNLSCTYALTGETTKTLEYLKKSIEAGYFDYSHLMSDKDLDGIREKIEFKMMVEPLRKVGDYMYILKMAGSYNSADNRELPSFTYMASDEPNLKELRRAFHLDSIAGNGDEIAKIKNLMHWIHNLIPHDGNHGNPVVKNAMSMIAECKRDHRGLNCRGLATVLNECYLSIGIKSRFITCLPKDSLKMDNDCHVINMVYSETLKKWLWMDPTNDAWVMNEKGDLLSIEEVRERLINNQPLAINPDANWNRRSAVKKEDYLYRYMAKNLYMLECPVASKYNSETIETGKVVSYIKLLPMEHFDQKPDKTDMNGMIVYKTNNAKLFWQAPKN